MSSSVRSLLHKIKIRKSFKKLFVRGGVLTLALAIALTVYLTLQEQDIRQVAKGKGGGKPNIILILTDDQRYDTMKYMPKTEKLLGKRGITFTNAYITTPLCCPSRASILSGEYAHDHGVLTNHGKYNRFKDKDTLPVWLQKAGYRTGIVGKYFNIFKDAKYVPPGWDNFQVDIKNTYYGYNMNENGQETYYGYDPDDYSTYVYRDMVINFIQGDKGPVGKKKDTEKEEKNTQTRATKSNKPFFVIFSTNAVHTDGGKSIFEGKKGKGNADAEANAASDNQDEVGVTADELEEHYQDRNDEVDIESDDSLLDAASSAKTIKDYYAMPGPKDVHKCKPIKDFKKIPSFNEKDVSDKPKKIQKIPQWNNNDIKKAETWAESQVCTLKAVDDAVDDIVKAVGKDIDNTVIIYMSDNGYSWGENRWSRKACVYDSCAKVPLIISYPKMTKKGGKSDALVANVDITATIADLAGAKIDKKVDGVSLVPILKDDKKSVRDSVLLEVFNYGDSFAVRTSKYLYAENENCELELYDIKKDQYNLENLIDDEKYQDTINDLSEKLDKLMEGKKKRKCAVKKNKKSANQNFGVPSDEEVSPEPTEENNLESSKEFESDDSSSPNTLSTKTFRITALLHGIGASGDSASPNTKGNPQPVTTKHNFTAKIYQDEKLITTSDGTLSYDKAGGTYTGSFSGKDVPSGTIVVAIMIPKYLSATTEIAQADDDSTTVPPLTFTTGDVNNDDALDLLDFNLITVCFAQNEGETCGEEVRKQSDLDDNGIVDERDINLYLRELSAKDY